MAESNSNSPINEVPDKNLLWGWWYKDKDWQSNLHRKAAHKALDIPEDMGDISSTKQVQSGMGWKELAAIGAMGLGGAYMFNDNEAATVVTTPPAVVAPAVPAVPDSEYEVRFYDKDGNQISVPRLQQ